VVTEEMLTHMFPEQDRNKKIKGFACWGFLNLFQIAYLAFMIAIFWDEWKTECLKELSVWVLVYSAF